MALPDLTNLTKEELFELISVANNSYILRQQSEAEEENNRKVIIADAIQDLNDLLGPEGGPANQTTIRGVLAYGDSVIAANPGQAAVLAIKGLEILTETVLEIAKVVSKS